MTADDVFNVNTGTKEERKLQEGSEVASQRNINRTEPKEVSLVNCMLLFLATRGQVENEQTPPLCCATLM